jgi:hypothetical protein
MNSLPLWLLFFLYQVAQAQVLSIPSPTTSDVSALQRRVEACSRWRDERAYDAERLKEIRRNECYSCIGNDKRFIQLKKIYSSDADIRASLNALEGKIDTTYQQQIDECRLLKALPKYH